MSRSSLLALLFTLSGCAVGTRLTADRRDYTLYRETRVAATPELRLGASGRYLKEMPSGRFRGEVARSFAQTEPRFFAQAYDRPSLLRAYLRALPDGPHAKEALARLDEFGLLNQFRARNVATSESFVRRVETELVAAENGRQALIREISTLVSLMVRSRSFGAPTSELDHDLIFRFHLAPPAGVCAETRCTKRLAYPYAVPNAGKLLSRELTGVFSIALDSGRVAAFSLAGPEMFDRIAEAIERKPIDRGNLLARTESIARAVQVFENAASSVFSAPECRKDVIAPVVLLRECGGVRLSVTAATEPGQVDRVDVIGLPSERR